MKKIIVAIVFSASLLEVNSQGVGIGTPTPNPSAQLEISSTNKGTLITRMTTAQRKAIVSPADGLLVYDTEKKTIFMYDNNRWQALMFAGDDNKLPPVPLEVADGQSGDQFGYSVSINGDYAIVGAPLDNGTADNQGSAYIFFRSGGVWTQQAKLISSEVEANASFGYSVDISGSFAIVGSPFKDVGVQDVGRAYVFTRSGTTWTQTGLLVSGDGLSFDRFGSSVSINGNYAIVGAPTDDGVGGVDQGSAYIYDGTSGWIFGQGPQAKLTASDGLASDGYGISVDINGDDVIVGAYQDDGAQINQGSAYTYLKPVTNWTTGQAHQSKLTASVVGQDFLFGSSVTIGTNHAAVGSPNTTMGQNTNQGAVYIYQRAGPSWVFFQQLLPADGESIQNFGNHVSITSNLLIVGAHRDNVGGIPDQGSAYLYRNNGPSWIIVRKIDDNNPESDGRFGISVGISGQNIIIGAAFKSGSRGEVAFLNLD